MTVWLLILTISTMGTMYIGGPPTERVLVASPEVAAIRLWECQQSGSIWIFCTGKLYEINVGAGTVRAAPIPALTFGEGKP